MNLLIYKLRVHNGKRHVVSSSLKELRCKGILKEEREDSLYLLNELDRFFQIPMFYLR